MMRTNRSATVTRKTGETDITITLTLDGNQDIHVDTGIGFLDHMLHLLAKHGRFGLAVKAVGDTYVDAHHTVEDIALTLGQALTQALGDKAGIERYGDAWVPMDEALTQVVIDPYDEAFGEPEKIIGRVLNSEEAEAEEEKGNFA